ncbi:Ig domain-containing protein, partial [Rhizobiaceae sp. 2RAB30]
MTGAGGVSVTSDVVKLVFQIPQLAIISQPEDRTVDANVNTTLFSVVAENATGYQWQFSADSGASWTDILGAALYSGSTSNTLSTHLAMPELNGFMYRVVVSGPGGPLTSEAATLTVSSPTGPAITSQPSSQAGTTKSVATFYAGASNATRFQWQVKAGSSATWEDVVDSMIIRGGTRLSMSVVAPPLSMNGYQFRLVASDDAENSVVSNSVTLTVTQSQITLELSPTAGTMPEGKIGEPYSFTFTASGGQPPYRFVMGGDHPPGITIDPDTGVFSGTPMVAYPFKPTISVTDANNDSATGGFLFTVKSVGMPSSDASLASL